MTLLADDSAIITKAKELCAEIAGSPLVTDLQAKIECFLSDDQARNQYKNVHEMGEQLHQKQHAGLELSAAEIKSFETARDALFASPVACDFMEAQHKLEKIQKEIGKYVSMTLELGRVPTADDLAESGGCCGGGGGCGCHDEDDHDHDHGHSHEHGQGGCGNGGCGCR
jgi:cell fate (sporulation/competence/biofilm development) regulator YlbF (YheA/YmcA/DUF963 family)